MEHILATRNRTVVTIKKDGSVTVMELKMDVDPTCMVKTKDMIFFGTSTGDVMSMPVDASTGVTRVITLPNCDIKWMSRSHDGTGILFGTLQHVYTFSAKYSTGDVAETIRVDKFCAKEGFDIIVSTGGLIIDAESTSNGTVYLCENGLVFRRGMYTSFHPHTDGMTPIVLTSFYNGSGRKLVMYHVDESGFVWWCRVSKDHVIKNNTKTMLKADIVGAICSWVN
jgi:hypothetical protein